MKVDEEFARAMPAVRAFNKLWAPKQERHAFGAQMDAGYDCGEFSGSAHAAAEQDDYEGTLLTVAEAFGLAEEELTQAIWRSDATFSVELMKAGGAQ